MVVIGKIWVTSLLGVHGVGVMEHGNVDVSDVGHLEVRRDLIEVIIGDILA
jgi:hypothetical protein